MTASDCNSFLKTLFLRSFSISDSIIGIRSNVSLSDPPISTDIKPTTAMSAAANTATVAVASIASTPMTAVELASVPQLHENQTQCLFDASRDQLAQKTLTASPMRKAHGTSDTLSAPSKTISPPIITITSSDDDKTIDGMLDRISHDLDYLLNRTTDVPTPTRRYSTASTSGSSSSSSNQIVDIVPSSIVVPPPPLPPTSSILNMGHSHPNLSVHEVILEEE